MKNKPLGKTYFAPSPKVSVLIPVYNNKKHLAQCLDSGLAQDFRDTEIVIADDKFADGTPQIIQQYADRDSRIPWWQNPQNLGFVPNHNFCLRQARGEYSKFVHADDKLLLEHLVLIESYYAKPWLKTAASRRMLFAQIYCLKKPHGRRAEPLTSALLSQLKPRHFAWQLLKHKGFRPLQKSSGRAGRFNPLLLPRTPSTRAGFAD